MREQRRREIPQAEIEAAAEAMMESMFAPHELPLNAGLRAKYRNTARFALEAAAKVGPAGKS